MMPIRLLDSKVEFVPLVMTVSDFTKYLLMGIEEDSETFRIEDRGQELVQQTLVKNTLSDDDKKDKQEIKEFVEDVCKWGGYRGIATRVNEGYPEKTNEIATAFRDACAKKDVREALRCVVKIKHLAVSFGSKHLRFLDPEKYVVLDSIISEKLGYPRDEEGDGYKAFVDDCEQILKMLKEQNVPYPCKERTEWRIADIEMAIYRKIRGKKAPRKRS